MAPLLHLARYRDIASALGANPDQEIIVASAGLASAIAAEMLRQSGAGAVSPRIRTIDTFARQVVNDAGEFPRVASDAERRLAMRSAIAAIRDPMMETRGIAAMLERSYRDVRDSAMTLGELEARLRDSRATSRMPLILSAWRAYERRIVEVQAVDAAEVLTRAAELIQSRQAAVAPQIVAGFYDMTGAQLRLVSALGSAEKLTAFFVPAGEGEAYAFASRLVTQLDSSFIPHPSSFHIRSPAVFAEQFADTDGEVRAVCRAIRDLLHAGTPANAIGITARALDADDVRLLQRFSAELGFTISETSAVPLVAHRLGRAIANLLRLRERDFPRGEVIELLRDGYRPERKVRADDLDLATRRARIAGGRSTEIRNPLNDSRIDDYRAVVAELESLPTAPAALIGSALARFRPTTDLDLAAAVAIDDVLALLARTRPWNARFDTQTIIDLLEQHVLPRQPATGNRPPVVWAGDLMTFRGRSFDHLFVVRMEESLFPQRRVDDPLLPDVVRRQIGMREIGDGRDEERLLFQLLLDGAGESVHFSCAASDRFGKILRASPLLKSIVPGSRFPVSSAGLATGNRQPATANLPRQLQLMARAGTKSVFDGYLGDDAELGAEIIARLQTVSPTRLEDFGECPQKFLFKQIFGVEDYDDPDRELQMHHREKGKLDHQILERFYRNLDEGSLQRARAALPQLDPALRERIDGIVDELFAADEMRLPAFSRLMREIERKTTKRNLHAFLANDIEDLLTSKLRPGHFEYTFGRSKYRPADHAEAYVIEAHGIPIRVEGSVDRIDEGEDVLRVVDYKSGKAQRHSYLADKIDRGVRLQIALYAMAVAQFFGRRPESVNGAIKPLIVRGTDPRKLAFCLGEKESRLRETLDLFVRSMLRGAFPAFPNEGDDGREFNSCKYCPVKHSCRTRHSQKERRALDRIGDPRTLLESMP